VQYVLRLEVPVHDLAVQVREGGGDVLDDHDVFSIDGVPDASR
jgi:hypothetical protein